MSAVSSTSSSATAYATQLAQASAVKRSLSSLGTAIQSGDLTSANSILTSFIKVNPQYASGSTASTSADPISQDFQTLATAISNNQLDAAQTAWAKVKTDLANDGVTGLDSSSSSTANILAQTKTSMDSEILSDMFGTSSDSSGDTSIASLLGGSTDSSSQTGLSSSLIGSWLTYQQSGTATSASTSNTTGINLDTEA